LKAVLVNAAFVGAGGFIGAVCRYFLSGLVQRSSGAMGFPFGTLAVNMIGCLIIGVFVGMFDSRQMLGAEIRMFMMAGVLGGFTTYSTFGLETFALMRDAEYLRAATNVTVHVVLGLALVWVGYALVSRQA
jgi:CrcB protein